MHLQKFILMRIAHRFSSCVSAACRPPALVHLAAFGRQAIPVVGRPGKKSGLTMPRPIFLAQRKSNGSRAR